MTDIFSFWSGTNTPSPLPLLLLLLLPIFREESESAEEEKAYFFFSERFSRLQFLPLLLLLSPFGRWVRLWKFGPFISSSSLSSHGF